MNNGATAGLEVDAVSSDTANRPSVVQARRVAGKVRFRWHLIRSDHAEFVPPENRKYHFRRDGLRGATIRMEGQKQ